MCSSDLLVIGQEVDTSLSTKGTDLRVARVVVTNENVLGKRIRDLHFKERYDVVISVSYTHLDVYKRQI